MVKHKQILPFYVGLRTNLMLWKGVWLFRKGVWDYLWGMTSLKYLEGADYEINA